MLSLEHAASGTNLTEATHIVLMDPVAGTPAKAVSIEQQAIGRAHRMGQNKQVCTVYLIIFSSASIHIIIIIIIRTFVTRAVSANILNLRRRQSLGEEDGGSEV